MAAKMFPAAGGSAAVESQPVPPGRAACFLWSGRTGPGRPGARTERSQGLPCRPG